MHFTTAPKWQAAPRAKTAAVLESRYAGIDLDLEHVEDRRYALGFPETDTSEVLHMREVAMMMLMDQITDKPNWHKKVFDEGTVQKWRDEAATQSETPLFARITQEKEYDRIPQPHKIVSLQVFEYASRSRFIKKEKVGTLNSIEQIGKGDVVPEPFIDPEASHRKYKNPYLYDAEFWSKKYQWLPANVKFCDDGSVAFSSYINNLHPVKYQGIYKSIEKAIAAAIPLWDQCLQEEHNHERLRRTGRSKPRFEVIREADDNIASNWNKFDLDYYLSADIELIGNEEEAATWDDGLIFWDAVEPRQEALQDGKKQKCTTKAQREKLERELEARRFDAIEDPKAMVQEKRAYAKWYKTRQAILPEPLPFEEVDYAQKESIRKMYKRTGLQVIVKLVSIELSPEKPEFPAGGWHLEGLRNENICATALFYLDSENIADSHISFRAQTDSGLNEVLMAAQDGYNYIERVFGTGLGTMSAETWQAYGDMRTPQGRLLAFPNTLQHRVSAFKLQDRTKPGHRRFLALWLVDPHMRVISTANVPPQQMEWWADDQNSSNTLETQKPQQESSPPPPPTSLMTMEEAREHRIKLMEERGMGEKNKWMWGYHLDYGFCEH